MRQTDFKRIANNGLGDGLNSYAHSMAWFNGHLYVGTSRATLSMVKVNEPPPALVHWPVNSPPDVYELDRRAHIWRYDPQADVWQQVFLSPIIKGRTGEMVARDIGYRGITVYKGTNDPTLALYVCTWSSSKGQPPLIMRSFDGITFEDLPAPSWRDSTINTFRTLLPFRGRVFTTPTGKTQGYGQARECITDVPIVFESRDPASGSWREASIPGFGDPDNLTIFELCSFSGLLYAGTLNAARGFQIWKTKATGKPPYHWTCVITDGAYRGCSNELVVSMCVFKDTLYVGTGVINGGYDRVHKIGPAASEIIRIHPDDSWDLIVGEPRLTPQGFKFPMSGLGAGFDNLFNGYIWRLTVHDGWLYAGTYKWNVLLPYLPLDKWPENLSAIVRWIGLDNIVQDDGGFDLWRTNDGVKWTLVTSTGFSNPYNWGVRTMVSTPCGLFIGTANPFGPEIAIRKGLGWKYESNPLGGLEVWLGAKKEGDLKPASIRTGHSVVELSFGTPARGQRSNRVPLIETLKTPDDQLRFDPFVEEYYQDSGYQSVGYWLYNTGSQREACENLIERLLNFLPEKRGNILDVGCGYGGTSKYLLRYYSSSQGSRVTGITSSKEEIDRCRRKVPDCQFLLMDAAALAFGDNFFDTIICVESAFHFKTREHFLREAWRVLKPDGYLILSDILRSRLAMTMNSSVPEDNYVQDLDQYRALWKRAGFNNVELIDSTNECSRNYHKKLLSYAREQFRSGCIDAQGFGRVQRAIVMAMVATSHYVLVSGRKPHQGGVSQP